MIDEDGWHYVRPLGVPSLSVMVTGKPWTRQSPGKGLKHAALADNVVEDLLHQFGKAFPKQK